MGNTGSFFRFDGSSRFCFYNYWWW
jgi:hypothetical protein